jgi:ribosomal protein L29
MAVTTDAQTETPSQHFEEQIHKILTPTNVRKQFNDTVTCYKNLNNTRTTIDFLQASLKSKIIPPTFMIKNTIYNITDNNITKVENLLHQTSTTLMKITIDSLKTKEHTQFKIHLNKLHTLLNLIPENTDKDRILDKLTQMESQFRNKTTERSIQRLHWLKQKQLNNRTQTQKQNANANTTEQPNNQEHPHQHKTKKHRRFV